MKTFTFVLLVFLLSPALAFDSISTFHGVKVSATIYGASCSGSGLSGDCYSKPGDRISVSYSVENTETIVKDVCFVLKPNRINIDSSNGFSQDKAHNIYCIGSVCDVYSIDQCFSELDGGGVKNTRLEFKSPENLGDFWFDTELYLSTERGKDNFKATQSFHSVECITDSDCTNVKCAGHVCGGIPTTTTSTTLAPVKYDYESNKTVPENAQSIAESAKSLFFRLPLVVQVLIGFVILAIVGVILNKIIG